MGDIGKEQEEIEFEPMEIPSIPEPAPATPSQPVHVPQEEPVPV